MKIDINQRDFGTLCICAIRYCQGRQSYMPSIVRRIVKESISNISDMDLEAMLRDCKFQDDMNMYGDELIDKPKWIEWREFLQKEQERRQGDESRAEDTGR